MSDTGRGCFAGCGYGGRGRGGRSRIQGRGRGPPAYIGGYPQEGGIPQGGFLLTMGCPMGAPHGPPVGFPGTTAGGISLYCAPAALVINGGYGPPSGGYGIPRGPPVQANVQQPYCNVVKHYSN
jgi:hypothetical protein